MEARIKNMASQAQEFSEGLHSATDRVKAFGSTAWERTKAGCATAQEKVVAGAKATDRTIRENPYQSIGIAFGIGLFLGYLIKRSK
jgi:ElaB/YqjD/DUF883 family membrane-anchored ribosome-binding protein